MNKKTLQSKHTVEWHRINASGKVLGRIASEAASLLLGKHSVYIQRNTVAPVCVVITNTDAIRITGKKRSQKMYRHHTGYPGHIKEKSLDELMHHDSRNVIRKAVEGMLPKNSLRKKRLGRLKLYTGSDTSRSEESAAPTP